MGSGLVLLMGSSAKNYRFSMANIIGGVWHKPRGIIVLLVQIECQVPN